MQTFTGWQYLLIDVANNHHSSLDKETFDTRIAWAEDHLATLEVEAENRVWKERPMYLKACMAVRDALKGKASGHMVGFDAICSGIQIMSVLTGCLDGARATGLVDTNRRADAYTDCTTYMSRILGRKLNNMRAHVKQALMTHFYGSKEEPKNEFGRDSAELQAFYVAAHELAPGPSQLLTALLQSWDPSALVHAWKLPDGFDARVKVMERRENKIEVDELNHSTFTYVWYENREQPYGVKNAANVVHSVDAYVLRSLVRRCNYDWDMANEASDNIAAAITRKGLGDVPTVSLTEGALYYQEQYIRSTVADIAILPHLTQDNCMNLTTEHLLKLSKILDTMLQHEPFDVVTVHDDFKCHPNHMNYLREHYRNILAELADSNVLDDLLTQLFHRPVQFNKQHTNLSQFIYNSNYALS